MKQRIHSLNFIRILGMTMILLFHAWLLYGFSMKISWLDHMISIGAIFVIVFFMLSGFGLRKGNKDLSLQNISELLKFYKKRFLSIYPLFLLLTVVALLFQFRVMDSFGETLSRLPIQFSMLHILFGKEMHEFLFNDNCWYISALFVLYLLFPLLNALANRLTVQAKVILCVVLWIVSFGIYFYCVYGTKLTFLDYYPNPFLRIPEFMIGMLTADLSEDIEINKALPIVLVTTLGAGFGLFLLRPHFMYETNLYGIIVIPCTVVVFLCFANWTWLNEMGAKPIVRWLASLGLEIYLCQSFATLFLTHVKIDGQWDELAFICLTILFAVLTNTFFSKPISRKVK